MKISISEHAKGGWSLWVTEGTSDAPIVTASRRTQEQIFSIVKVLLAEADAGRVETTPPPAPVAASHLTAAAAQTQAPRAEDR